MKTLTDKEIKIMVVYNEDSSQLSIEDMFKYNAYAALWDRITNIFINDDNLTPVNPLNS